MSSLILSSIVLMTLATVLINGCGPTMDPDNESIVSVEYTIVSGQFGSQKLKVDAASIRYFKQVGNYPEFSQDTVVADSAFLEAVVSTIDIAKVVKLEDRVDYNDIALDGSLHAISIVYQVKSEIGDFQKVVEFTEPAHDELSVLVKLLSDKMIQLRDK